jgi:CIC family chloride channel protein
MRLDVLKLIPRFLQPKQLAVVEACLIGLVSGLAAVFLKQGAGLLSSGRLQIAHTYPAWIALPLIGLAGGLVAGLLIEWVAPEASGSGIPQVKAALGGVAIALNARVALVKLVSTLLSLGSGLTLGRQGPTVQIGAAIAAQLSAWVPTSPDHRRQLIAAGAAAGLAAGFNAPIAGVLFVVEELLQDVSGLTLGTAILASFVGAVVSRLLGGQGLNVSSNILRTYTSFSAEEIPLFLVLGILAGLLGTLFSRGIIVSLQLHRHVFNWSLPWRIGCAGLISGLAVALLPSALRDGASLQEVWITSEFGWQIIAVIFIAKFVLTLVAFSSGAPGGLFAPSLILGSTMGYLVGSAAQYLQTTVGIPLGVDATGGLLTTSALTGMGAFFSAVTRGPITAIVIVFEMTTDFNLVLPLMIGSVTAYLVAEAMHGGSIYKHLLALKGIEIDQKAEIDLRLGGLTAADIMQRRVETLASQMRLEEAMQAFSRSHHRGFPVVDDGMLVGIVTQTDLSHIQERSLAGDLPLSTIMTPQPVTVKPSAPLTQVLYLLNRYKISRLPVIDRRKLVGIITRADIIRAESDKLSEETAQLGPQPEPSYVVYQTQAPATGRGRLLVPIANPQTADALLQMAAAIARDRRYELECLQVIVVPRHQAPAETQVSTSVSRKLLKRASRLGKTWQIPVHTQVRVTHDVSHAILETLKERHVDLIVMGWKGSTSTPGRVFGSVVDTIVRQAGCDVVLVKMADGKEPLSSPQFDRWLIPTAGGPNSRQAIRLLPALARLSQQPEICLCQVHHPNRSLPDAPALDEAMTFLSTQLNCPVSLMPVSANSVSEAVIHLAQKDHCDVIVLGATREGLLQQAIQGNIPEEIARKCNCTVVLVREAIK